MAPAAYCLPLAFLFLASVIPSEAQKAEAVAAAAAVAEAEAGEESEVRVALGAPLTVECRLRAEQRAEWRRDGAAPPPDLRAAPEAAAAPDRLWARLRADSARAQHAGLYTCAPDRRHRVRVVVLPPPAAGAEAGAATEAGAEVGAGAGDAPPEVLFDVRGNFTLRCPLTSDKNQEYVWRKNETEISLVWEMKDRYAVGRGGAEFFVARAVEDDFGNYSCALGGGGGGEARWAVRGRPHLKLPANTNVVEGQKLKLTCRVVGKPYPRLQWAYSNSSEGPFAPLAAAALADVTLADSDAGVPDGVLLVAAAARAHAGRYRCDAPHAREPSVTTLRVKDMYAALWPFLGICAEVFVLCAIILLYERRRAKPDLDDSDTDNHDQKKS